MHSIELITESTSSALIHRIGVPRRSIPRNQVSWRLAKRPIALSRSEVISSRDFFPRRYWVTSRYSRPRSLSRLGSTSAIQQTLHLFNHALFEPLPQSQTDAASKLLARDLDPKDRKSQRHARGLAVTHRMPLAKLRNLESTDDSPLARHICFYGDIRPSLLQLFHQVLEVSEYPGAYGDPRYSAHRRADSRGQRLRHTVRCHRP